ncbi:kinase-like domain-containing protein [Aspergillus unguis]
MDLFRRRKDYEILTIRTALHEEMVRQDDHSKTFISLESLRKIWTEKRLKGFAHLYRAFPDAEITYIRKNLLQTLSILVDIKWDRWGQFQRIFLQHDRRTDADIPQYDGSMLERFLGIETQSFLALRYIYCPVDIEEGKGRTLGPGWRLPSLSTEEIGEGGYGSVTKELIPSRHLRYKDKSKTPDDQPMFMACKRFKSYADFDKEKKNLQILQDQLRGAQGIVPFFTTITIDKEFNLFFECADMDLEQFLSSRPESMSLKDLIEGSCDLARALAYLQEDIDPQLRFCHMDLKPANILVYRNTVLPRGWEWKIADFGISVIRAIEEPPHSGETFRFPLMAMRGVYQSPEVANGGAFGRKSDIWSLGCILVRILAFGLGHGPDELAELDEKRARTDNGLAYYEHDLFHRGNPPVRNPHIEAWLNELPSRTNTGLSSKVLTDLRDLLLHALEINISDRPSASEIKRRLSDVLQNLPRAAPPSNVTEVFNNSPMPQDEITSTTTPDHQPPDHQPPWSAVNTFLEKYPDNLHLVLKWELDVEENFEAPSKKHDRLLIHAIRYQSYEAVERLLERPNLDKESINSDGHTPLNCAIGLSDDRIVSRLLQAGVDVNAPSMTGITPLMQATRFGHLEIARILLRQGAEVMATSNLGYTCLHFVAYAPRAGAELIEEFKTRMSIDTYSSITNETPFALLIRESRKEYYVGNEWWAKFNAFLDARVNVNAQGADGKTPLYHAVRNNLDVVTAALRRHNATMGPKHPLSEDNSWQPTEAMKHLMHSDPELQRPSNNPLRRIPITRPFHSGS